MNCNQLYSVRYLKVVIKTKGNECTFNRKKNEVKHDQDSKFDEMFF